MKAARESANLELQVVVGASAVLYRFGNVRAVIEQDGFEIDAEMHSVVEGNEPVAMSMSAGLAGIELSGILNALSPDVVVVVADRYEQIATAISSAYMNIPVAHLQGGELTGSIDDSVRHAISKLAHIHFPATQVAGERLVTMGEDPRTVHVIGCPAMDLVVDSQGPPPKEILQTGVGSQLDPDRPYLLVVQHPVTTEYLDAYSQVAETLAAVRKINEEFGTQVVWLWPNVDAGSDSVSKRLREFRESDGAPGFHFFRNFSPEDYIRILRGAKCIVGNSSSGIREASFMGVPSVSVGSRQSGRERSPNVIDVGYSAGEIESAIRAQLDHGVYESSSLYGNGTAGAKMAMVLESAELNVAKTFYEA
jgi:UDP-hydrolysing UDP-N-acetyl-D-glucosamine 2-epimerase